MQHWDLHVIVYVREGRFEAEAINAAIAGVGTSLFEALHSFEEMAGSMAVTAAVTGAHLTFEPEVEDSSLFHRVQKGEISDAELAERGIVGIGSLGLGLEGANADSKAILESAKVELVGGAA